MNYKDLNDYEIFYRIRENDDMALNDMFLKYEPLIVKIARKYYAVLKRYGFDFEDLVQEGRVAVNKAINSYDVDGKSLFYTYVGICINRHMISLCRNINRSKRNFIFSANGSEYLELIADMTGEPCTYVFDIYGAEQFINYKNMFDIEDSSIFELKYNGFSYKEISKLLDLPINHINSRLSKIRKTLHFIKNKL